MDVRRVSEPAVLIADFSAAAGALSMDGWPRAPCMASFCPLRIVSGPAAGFGAVYAFALSARTTSASPGSMRRVKPWMLSKHDRLHIYVPAGPVVLASLEMYLRARIGSVFKGSA